MRAEYKRDVSRNYLILHGENPVDTASYQVRMLTGNAVPSILKCRIQGLDGRFLFYYDITSRQSLASFYEQKKLKASDLRIIFGGVVKIMEEMMEFLLNPDQLLLSPEYMYLDVEKQKLYFCCLPGEAKAVSEQFREMTEYFLPKLDHDDAAAKNKEPTKPEEKISEQTVLREEQIPLDFAEKPPEWEEKSETSNKTGGKICGNFVWIGGCGLGVFVLLGILAACYLGYLPGVPIEAVLAAAIALLGIGALGMWAGEKKKKKQDETAEWRKKVRREFTDAAGNTEKAEQHKKFRDEYRERLQFEEPEETDYGETVVLSAGAVKGPSSLVSKEPGELATIFLERDLTIIGKMENAADAVIPRPTVSRVHARIRKDEEEYFLADLNSRNGTSVNGRMLRANEEYQLQDEDEVDFAEARYIFIK